MVVRAVLACALMVPVAWGQSHPQPPKTDLVSADSQIVCRFHAIQMARKEQSKAVGIPIPVERIRSLSAQLKEGDRLYFNRDNPADISLTRDDRHPFDFYLSTLNELIAKAKGGQIYGYPALNRRQEAKDSKPKHHKTVVLTTMRIDLSTLEAKAWKGPFQWPSCEDGGHRGPNRTFMGFLKPGPEATLHEQIDAAGSVDAEHTPP